MRKNKLLYLLISLLFIYSLTLLGCKKIDDIKDDILTSIKIENVKTYSSNVEQNNLSFINNGKITITENTILVENMEPKDKITFDIILKNDSIVDIKTQILLYNLENNDLFKEMEITIDDKKYLGMNAYTNWYNLKTDDTEKEKTIKVTIYYPDEKITNKTSNSYKVKVENDAMLLTAESSQLENKELGIKSTTDFILFKDAINNGHDFKDSTIKLLDNLNFENSTISPIINNKNKLENVTIDGNNHIIKNVKLENGDNGGIISYNTSKLNITNLTIENINIETTKDKNQTYAGSIIGKNYANVIFENVSIKNAKILNNWQCGGYVGYSETYAPKFIKCSIEESFIGGKNATAGCFFGLGVIDINLENCTSKNVKLYTDGLTWESTQKLNSNYYVGHLYGKKLTVTSCKEENVTVVDSIS